MSNLQPAHRGYEYQDLMVAARSVDLILGKLASALADEKLVKDDRFDDLTTMDDQGCRERVQFKHTDSMEQALSLASFTSDSRQLVLDRLVACAIADRDGPGSAATSIAFRVILRDSRPTSDSLLRYLKPARHDPGPFLPEMMSYRLKFDVEELWPTHEPRIEDAAADGSPFAFLQTAHDITRTDVAWLCERLVVEVEAPEMSGDLGVPGAAETLLLNRAIQDIGAGQFPNAHRTPGDVGQALVTTARMARQGRIQLSAGELLRRTQIRRDFGTVAHHDPVDSAIEVARPMEVAELAEVAVEMARVAKPIIIGGPPGQGKSWSCKQLVERLRSEGWLVAEHYCFLGAADNERDARVYTESIFGTLLDLIGDFDPSLVREQRPRFAASQFALEDAINKSLQHRPTRPVALVVDGLDHVSRVAPPSRATDPSRQLAEELAGFVMPTGSVLIVLSQPGDHLEPLVEIGARLVQAKGLSLEETAALARRHGITTLATEGTSELDEIVGAIYLRSRGNALYSTYLCRELVARGGPTADALATVNSLPAYDGSLQAYYQHLYESLGAEAEWVADYLAFLDFDVSPHDLADIQPDRAHHVRGALKVLGPVLDAQAPGGNLRIYHESFSRFLADRYGEPIAEVINDRIASWLFEKGFLADERAYRFLIPSLAKAGNHAKAIELVDADFLKNSVAAGFPASAILSNLSAAVGSAAHLNAWPVIVRCIELARGATTFEYERLDTVFVDFADVPIALIGGEELARRLLFKGRPVVPARTGLEICAALDARGIPAPWEPFIEAFSRENANDDTSYGHDSDAKAYAAILRGQLRIPEEKHSNSSESKESLADSSTPGWVGAPESLKSLVKYIDTGGLPADKVAGAVVDTKGPAAAFEVALRLEEPASFALAAACHVRNSGRGDPKLLEGFLDLALRSDRNPGCASVLLDLGVPIAAMLSGEQRERREILFRLTEEAQHPIEYDEAIDNWLDHCVIAAVDDPIGLATAEASIKEDFWYRNWLRFTIHVARAEIAEEQCRSDMAVSAIRLLNLNTDPFAGKPRACDLFRVWKQISATIGRAVRLLDDEAWHDALKILSAMSGAISTSIDGELGGPFAADDLLRLAVETGATPERQKAVADLIQSTLERNSAGRFYTDLAMFRLIAARLALQTGNLDEAMSQWVAACQMLSGYGYHKDRTIFEILAPLTEVIKADPRRGRERVAVAQPLAERIPSHTDQRETRHARSAWWRLLALADPVALVSLLAPAMLARCNLPSELHEKAREHLWRAWQIEVGPILANLLRITLDLPLDSDDLANVERLFEESARHRELEAQVLSVFEETQSGDSSSNGGESPDHGAERFREINTMADRWNAPRISLWSIEASTTTPSSPQYGAALTDPRKSTALPPVTFSLGMLGIAQALRAWRQRPYDATAPARDPAKYGNVIGYRLVGLIEDGRLGDAHFSLRSVAEADWSSTNQDLLVALAEGLERAGHAQFAAIAHAFRWTRSRGGGGWLTFGGETAIDSLCRALDLDRDATLGVIAEETQRAVFGGNLGVTQAIIFAFALADMPAPEGEKSLDVAFNCWDEAAIVIGARAPRVHPSDDPDEPYTPLFSDNGASYLGDLELAFALAIIAGVSNPGREQKRRSMLAVRMLFDYAPALAGQALQLLLPALDDPATLVWILRLVETSKERTSIVSLCGPVLLDLAVSDCLTVRSLARRLAPAEAVPQLPATPPDGSLLNRGGVADALWFPPGRPEEPRGSDDGLAEDLQRIAGTRIARGEAFLPRFRETVLRRLRQAVDDDQFDRRMRRQADALGRANGLPDAYIAPNEAIESNIQRIAAGGRLAMLANGVGVFGEQWEDQLADAIMDDALEPIELEATRLPRPPILIPPGEKSPEWIALNEQISGSMDASIFDHAYRPNGSELVAGTKIRVSANCAIVVGGSFAGWRVIGSEERRAVSSPGYRNLPYLVQRFSGLEMRESGIEAGFESPPLASIDSSVWLLRLPPGIIANPTTSVWPLVGYDPQMTRYGDAAHGLGIPERIMVPTSWLRALWHLVPVAPYVLGDEQGRALALITWRTEYERSDYFLPWPRMQGSAIVARPDLLHQLESKYGERLTLRDFIAGPVTMVKSDPA